MAMQDYKWRPDSSLTVSVEASSGHKNNKSMGCFVNVDSLREFHIK
jgi:hypothetical protein